MKIYTLFLAFTLSCFAASDLEKINSLISKTENLITKVEDIRKSHYKDIRAEIVSEIDTYEDDIRFAEGGKLFKKLKVQAEEYALYSGKDVNRMRGLYSIMQNTIKNTDYGSDAVCENTINQFIPEFFKVCDKRGKRWFDEKHKEAQLDKAALSYLKALSEPDPKKALAHIEKYTNAVRLIAFGKNEKLIEQAEMVQVTQRLTVDIVSGVPVVGDVLDMYAIVTGEDAAGAQLSDAERTISAVFMLGPDLYKLTKSPFAKKALSQTKSFFSQLKSPAIMQKLSDSTGLDYKKIKAAKEQFFKYIKDVKTDNKLIIKGTKKLEDVKNFGKKFIPNETDPDFDKWLKSFDKADDALLKGQDIIKDAKWRKGFKKAQQRVDDFKNLQNKIARDPNNEILQKQLMSRVIELNKDFGFKAIMKTMPDGSKRLDDMSRAFDSTLQRFYKKVDKEFVKKMNDKGFKDFTIDSIQDFRNASSAGTVGMDRDKGLLSLFSVPQNSKLENARQKLISMNTKNSRVLPMNEWSKANQKGYKNLLGEMKNRYKGWIDPQLVQNGKHVSERAWNEIAQKEYNKVYGEVAKKHLSKKALKRINPKKLAHESLQEVTSRANVEAYGDLGMLDNFSSISKDLLEQTVDVTRYKGHNALEQLGDVFGSHESSRGFVKDMDKVVRALNQAARKSGGKIAFKLKDNHKAGIELMKRIQTRSISPAQANAIMKKISGKSLETIQEEILSNYGAIKIFL